MKNNPKVSVVIPVYNVEKYLPQCLDSVINQTLKEIEIIIIDDGSKDASGKIADEYAKKDKRIRVFHRENGGYGKAMNFGFSQATGEYIGIAESDDFVSPFMFEKLYKTAKENDVEVVKSNFNYYWPIPDDKYIPCNFLPEEDMNQIIKPLERPEIFKCMPCIWAAIYKTQFIRDNNITFLETPGASYQDTSFNFKVWAKANKVYFIKDRFLNYRQDNETSSVNSKNKIFCVCDEYNEIENFLEKKFSNKKSDLLFLTKSLKFSCYYWNFLRLSKMNRLIFLKRMRQEFLKDYKNGLINRKYFYRKNRRKIKMIIYFPILFYILNFSKS